MRPEQFDNNRKPERSFKQWSEELIARAKRLDVGYAEIIGVVLELSEWNLAEYKIKLQEKIGDPHRQKELESNLMDIIKKFTKGDDRELVDTASHSAEAWYRLNDRYHANVRAGCSQHCIPAKEKIVKCNVRAERKQKGPLDGNSHQL